MLNIDIEKILREYKMKKAFVEATLARIEQYKFAIEHPEMWYKEISLPSSLDVSKNTNIGNSVVENRVIGKSLNEEIIKKWIEDDESRIFFKKLELEQIDKAMESLTKQERYIIELKCFDNIFWRDIEISYNDQFRQKNYVTFEALKRIKKDAINKLYQILKPFYKQFKII